MTKTYNAKHAIQLLNSKDERLLMSTFNGLLEAEEIIGSQAEQVELFETVRLYLKDNRLNKKYIVGAIRLLYRSPDIGLFKSEVKQLAISKYTDVRLAVASLLSNFAEYDEKLDKSFVDDEIVDLGIKLSRDKNAKVRDWATFQFVNGIDNDNERIRIVLKRNTKDSNRHVRQEAIAALAKRRDTSVYQEILKKIHQIDVANIWVQAAASTKDDLFIEALVELLAKRKNSNKYDKYSYEVEEALIEIRS